MKTFFLFFFSTVSRPSRTAKYGMALTASRRVMPGFSFPVNRTRTDSGMSRGMKPRAPAKATRPDPAGNVMPIGKRVCESPPVPTVSGRTSRLSQEWMTPSPGLRETPLRATMNGGRVLWTLTSAGLG